jgi:hypothetical protein
MISKMIVRSALCVPLVAGCSAPLSSELHFAVGTDQRLGVSFDQQDGSAVGGWTEYGGIGAYAHTARHALNCAEWCRTHDVAWRSSPRTARAGFRLG